ncbi:MAG: TolC family protein, partial [Gemmatimonadales bacterium]|nr:TolC family protein [Gemmatimonadales bacterium]
MHVNLCVASCVAGALWLFPGSVAGQEVPPARQLTLIQARELARRSSPEIAAARHAVAAAAGRERQAGAWPNP